MVNPYGQPDRNNTVFYNFHKGRFQNKKLGKSGQADCWVDPLPRSGQGVVIFSK